MTDLVGGHAPVAFGVLPPALGNITAGQLRVLAVTHPTRFSLLRDVPTANESGLPGFEAVPHYGPLAPAGTPRPIIDRANSELRKLVNLEEVQQRIRAEGGDPLTSTPDEYTADIDGEMTKRGTLIHRLNLKVD
jgi:tripartite-type tricarboxylate transporter receptor subunit TctC